MEHWLTRAEMLVGADNLRRLGSARIAVFGLGGVGGYVAEALARSGIGHLLLVDGDCFSLTNLNRQIGATVATVGMDKTAVMQQRIHSVNLECQVEVERRFYQPGEFEEFLSGQVDYVADAIDDTQAKVDLLAQCVQHHVPVISAMGTGNKLAPEELCFADISATQGCPLARSVRQRLRKLGIERGVTVVYSEEQPLKVEGATPGSMVFVPATAGLMMASYIVRKLLEDKS